MIYLSTSSVMRRHIVDESIVLMCGIRSALECAVAKDRTGR